MPPQDRSERPIFRASLASLEAGFSSYFTRWLRKQKAVWLNEDLAQSQILDSVLAILAGALGPLPHADLANLVRHWTSQQAMVTQRTLEPLRRFVIGTPEDGYVLSHPRLANYLRCDYFRDASVSVGVDRASFEWGLAEVTRLSKGDRAVERTSGYLMRNLSTHLVRAGVKPESIMTIVEDGWRKAWLDFEGGERGFALDVQRCARYVATAQSPQFPIWDGRFDVRWC